MGLDLAHYIPVKPSEQFDGYELIEEDDFKSSYALMARFEEIVEKHDNGIYFLYYRELGQQRKGMNQTFYKTFQPGYYVEKESVYEAFKYLVGDQLTSLEQRQTDFKLNFIDNFQEG